jgi:hypothetical protein
VVSTDAGMLIKKSIEQSHLSSIGEALRQFETVLIPIPAVWGIGVSAERRLPIDLSEKVAWQDGGVTIYPQFFPASHGGAANLLDIHGSDERVVYDGRARCRAVSSPCVTASYTRVPRSYAPVAQWIERLPLDYAGAFPSLLFLTLRKKAKASSPSVLNKTLPTGSMAMC